VTDIEWQHNDGKQNKQAASLTERDNRFGHFWDILGLGLLLGILATSGAKSDVTFLLGDPDFL